ncbi:MAG: WGR domain-containing protein [Firmicutes bacterium]|nr:WGR domain-containing protein [Bacillota bacterium]
MSTRDEETAVFSWYAQRIDGRRNMYRWYSVWLTQNLFGEWECWTAWGRLNRLGQRSMLRAHGSHHHVHAVAHTLQQQKLRRGYCSISR